MDCHNVLFIWTFCWRQQTRDHASHFVNDGIPVLLDGFSCISERLFFKMHDLNDIRVFLKEAVEDLDDVDDKMRRFLLEKLRD